MYTGGNDVIILKSQKNNKNTVRFFNALLKCLPHVKAFHPRFKVIKQCDKLMLTFKRFFLM